MSDTAPGVAPAVADACARLVRDGDPLPLPLNMSAALVSLSEDGAQVAVVQGNGGDPLLLLARSLSPWTEWPPALSEPFTACSDCVAQEFAVAPARQGAQPGFALAALNIIPHDDAYPSFAPVFHPAIPAGEAPISFPVAIREQPQLARGAGGHLIATRRVDQEEGTSRWTDLAYVPFGASAPELLGDVACGWNGTPLVAVPGGFLMVGESSVGVGPNACGGGAELSVLHVDEASRAIARIALPSNADLGDPAWCSTRLVLAPAVDGAWLVAQPADWKCEGGVGPTLVLRLGADGTPRSGWREIPLLPDDLLWGGAILGDRLIVVSLGSGEALRFTMVQANGQVRDVHEEKPAFVLTSPFSPLASPDGTRLLMALSGQLVRLACAPDEP